MALQLPHLGPRARKIARYVGFVLLALVTFVFALQMTFPFHRVKDKVVEVLSDRYEVTIGDVERGFIPGNMSFKAVSLRTRTTKPDDVPTTFFIQRLDLGIGLFALLRGAASVKLDAKIGSGQITGTIALSRGATSIDILGEELPSASLPMSELIGLPMSGKVGFVLELELPNNKTKTGQVAADWPRSEGRFELACPAGCTIGDGKAKLKAKLKNRAQQAFAEGGIDFGKVSVDSLLARVDIKNGKMKVSRFDTKSSDGELHVDVEVALAQDLQSSNVTGCLRFNGTESLRKREAKTHAAITTTGAPLGPDNLFHIKLDGPLREVRRIGAFCTPGAGGGGGSDTPVPSSRPNLTVTPETPSRPEGVPLPQQPPVANTPSPYENVPTPPPPAAPPPGTVVPTPAGDAGSASPAPGITPSGVPPPAVDGAPPAGTVVPSVPTVNGVQQGSGSALQ
jgi:type II secretion system protein N